MKKLLLTGLFALVLGVAAQAMQINGPLIGASLEKLAADPAVPTQGRIYYDTVNLTPKVCDGAACTTIVTPAQMVAALGFTPEDVANKSTAQLLGSSDILYPTQHAAKVYIDTAFSTTVQTTLGAIDGQAKTADGAAIAAQQLYLQTFDSTHPGVVTSSGGGTTNFLRADGTWAAPGGTVASVTGTAPIASTGGATPVISLNSNGVTNTHLAQMGAHTYKGNNSGSTANAVDVTSTQLTADLNLFSSTLQGLVPASGGGTTNFLRADGSWTSVGPSSPLTTKGDLYTFDTGVQRLGVGSNGQVLTADSTQSTGIKWATPSAGFTNPMTTLGDLIYEDATPTATRLAGNATTTKKFLTQTGTGAVSAVPSWATILGSDLPNPSSSTLGGIESIAAVTSKWINSISTSGVPSLTQPAFSDISGTASLTTQVTGALPILNGGTGQTTKTAAFDALSPLTTQGDVLFGGASGTGTRLAAGSANQLLAFQGSSTSPSWQSINQTNRKNYINANPDAAIDTAGWATYNDGASNVPVDGTGGTATNLTFSRNTSSPLRGSADFKIAQTNSSNIQGKGVSYAFTIDPADQAHQLSVEFDYNASSTFVAGNGTTPPLNDATTTTNAGNSDVEVFIYDVTNAVLIPVTPQTILGNGSNNFPFKGTFQTASNSTSYRLILHTATANANATGWVFHFANVFVGPQAVVQGSPVTDWASYTPTFTGMTTPTNIAVQYRRVGDSYEVAGSFNAGTVSGAIASISLPNGASIDNTKITLLNTTAQNGQIIGQYGNPSTGANSWMLTALGTSTNVVYMGGLFSGVSALQPKNGNDLLTTGTLTSFRFLVPIAGLASTTPISNGSDGRPVVATYFLSANSTPGANTQVNFDTKITDSHGAVTTGASWKFTAPVSANYLVSPSVANNGTGGRVMIYKNGSAYISAGVSVAGNGGGTPVNIPLVAGDFIDIRGSGASTYVGDPLDGTLLSSVSIQSMPVSASSATPDTVSARYYASATSISGSLTTVSWTTKDYDDHSGMSSGTYTISTAGKYHFDTALLVSGTFALNNSTILEVQKNGTVVSRDTNFGFASMTDAKVAISDTINCVAGDTIRVQVSSGATGPAIVSSNFDNYFSIVRVGN